MYVGGLTLMVESSHSIRSTRGPLGIIKVDVVARGILKLPGLQAVQVEQILGHNC